MHFTQALTLCALSAAGAWAAVPAKFSGESALGFTNKLVALGSRTVGSEAHRKAEQSIEAQLGSFGCRAEPLTWTAQTPAGPQPMKNILARIAGTSGKAVVISGHYDTKNMPGANFAGANDGGSSAGLLLELARVLCRQKQKDDVWLLWLDGEEATRLEWSDHESLYGSRWMASKWAADGTAGRIRALINVDMIGDRDLNLVQDMNSSSQLRELVWGLARELKYGQHFAGMQTAIQDDHIPFGRIGIPVLDLIDFDYGPSNSYWHTDRDTVDKLSARSFQIIGDVLLRTIERLGGI